MDGRLFFDYEMGRGNGIKMRVPEECREACKSCPIRERCQEWALKHEDWGFWAGTTKTQRRKMRRRLGIRLRPLNGLKEFNEIVGNALSNAA
jgi:hypothetical protein